MPERHDDFWNQRLAEDWTTSGVGYRALGRPFNTWMYRVRRHVFARAVATLPIGADTRILDVGSGTGLYLQWWKQAGAVDVTGSDLTSAAVANLQEHFAGARIEEFDVTAGPDPFAAGSFDVISCMDVLFHITDDDLYCQALQTMSQLLRPGGFLVFTENFVHRSPDRSAHQVNRSLPWIEQQLLNSQLQVRQRVPNLVLMNAQVDAPRAWRKTWGGLLRAVTLTAPTGWAAGAALYPIERVLTRWLSESPTTELAIAQRR